MRNKLSILIALTGLLVGCSGNGVQYARIADETLNTTGSIFIGRESQWIGHAIAVEVRLNGRPIALLSQGQSVSSKTQTGKNLITIIPAGHARLVYDIQEIRIEGSADTNSFVLIRVDEAIPGLGGQIRVIETEPKIFASAVGT
jgi:hypothetical protein